MLAIVLYIVTFLVGLVVGAYSHKWLAAETGAPASIAPTAAGVAAAAKDVASTVSKKV